MTVYAKDEDGLGQQYRVNIKDYSVELVHGSAIRSSTAKERRLPSGQRNSLLIRKPKLKKVQRPKSASYRTARVSSTKRSTLVPTRDMIAASFNGRPASAHGVGARFLIERARLLSKGNMSRSKARPCDEPKLEFDLKMDESRFRATPSYDLRVDFDDTMKGEGGLDEMSLFGLLFTHTILSQNSRGRILKDSSSIEKEA